MSTNPPLRAFHPQHEPSYEALLEIIQQQQQLIERLQSQLQHLRVTHPNPPLPLDPCIQASQSTLVLPTPPGPLNPYLLGIGETSGERYIPLTSKSCWMIGRGEDNLIVLNDRWMSRTHAMIQATGMGEFYLIDLGSRNGSFLNGRRVNIPVLLNDADMITFGQTSFSFHAPPQKSGLETTPDISHLSDLESPATALLHVRRLISVLVVDIRNFTVLTRNLDEQILSEVVGTWFRFAGEIIRESGSWVDKYIGDAVMAVWIHGTQEVGITEVQRLLKAVTALNDMTQQLHLNFPLPFPLRIGAGINTGYAMVGNTGSGDRPDYTALGDTVNAAFRLESSTKQLQQDVAIGLQTYQYLHQCCPGPLPFQQHLLQLKGYDAPTPAYACSFVELKQLLSPQSISSS
ncbi:FHA domain-containing protein [Synechococcales cyanobacterium C]|uniref:FHA domain-containing protein n=2 Tax=Petrachloros TaxID=2918834 RepID=A0A8K1ZY78_9CYAN|nr:adenylate/guanylate cyclase domain-containing protein [Petrachloros mirabilis]NCJ06032.1 FHA domain-containing protein [Petrachloros mirabilis ULC683]